MKTNEIVMFDCKCILSSKEGKTLKEFSARKNDGSFLFEGKCTLYCTIYNLHLIKLSFKHYLKDSF